MTVEEEEAEDIGREATALETAVEEGGMPAMEKVEKSAMARHTSINNATIFNSGSPRGFWPIPGLESFFKEKSPPGKYQTGGKPGGVSKECFILTL